MKTALRAAGSLWRQGYRYSKAGMILMDRRGDEQADALPFFDPDASDNRMKALDQINRRCGAGTLHPAITSPEACRSMRRARVSPRYTMREKEILQPILVVLVPK